MTLAWKTLSALRPELLLLFGGAVWHCCSCCACCCPAAAVGSGGGWVGVMWALGAARFGFVSSLRRAALCTLPLPTLTPTPPAPRPSSLCACWIYREISRGAAEQLLKEARVDGGYVVRRKGSNKVVVSSFHKGSFDHHVLTFVQGQGWFFKKARYFQTSVFEIAEIVLKDMHVASPQKVPMPTTAEA